MSRPDSSPPKFVPTLTEVVTAPFRAPLPTQAQPIQNATVGNPNSTALLDEQAWTARIMQDVDVTLESKLRHVIANVVSEQIAIMMPLLRNEVEQSVRSSVREALARQLR